MRNKIIMLFSIITLSVISNTALSQELCEDEDYVSPSAFSLGTLTGNLDMGGYDIINADDIYSQQKTTDAAPGVMQINGHDAWAGATGGNQTGGELDIGGGIGSHTITISNYLNCSLAVATVTVDGASTTCTEGTDYTAASSNNTTCASLSACVLAVTGVSGSSACAANVLRVVPENADNTLSVAIGGVGCGTVVNGTLGTVKVWTPMLTNSSFEAAGTTTFDNTVDAKNNVTLDQPVASNTSSFYLTLIANHSGSAQGASLQVIQSSDPYLEFQAPQDIAGTTSVLQLYDQKVMITKNADLCKEVGTHGAMRLISGTEQVLTCDGGGSATLTTTGLIPAGAMGLAVVTRILTDLTGSTGFKVGTAPNDDLYGVQVAATQGSTTTMADATANVPWNYPLQAEAILTFTGGDCTAGSILVTASYMTMSPATSN